MSVSGFNDARCVKCLCKIAWFGPIRDQPACPDCGYYDGKAVAELEQKINVERQRLLKGMRDDKA